MTFALSTGLVNPALAAESEVIAEISDKDKKTAVLPESESNKNILNYLELVDSFVTAERIPSGRWDTPANVYVITAQEIEDNHYQTLAEALRQVPGVFIGGGNTIEGLNSSNRWITLVDGHRSVLTTPIRLIERIEIIKGSGSALYGTNAVGGVINLITKKGTRNETEVDINAGSWKTQTYDIINQGVIGKFDWLVYGKIDRRDRPKSADDSVGRFEREDRDQKYLSIRLDNKFDDSSSVTFNFAHRDFEYNKYGFTEEMYPEIYYYDDSGNLQSYQIYDGETHNDKFSRPVNQMSITYKFKENTSTPSYLRYFYEYDSNKEYEIGRNRLPFRDRNQELAYQNGWEFGKHKIIAGWEWLKTNRESSYWSGGNRKSVNSAYYLQDTISFDDKWTLVPGLRMDHNSDYGNQWSPKVAVNYRADDKTKIYASWGNTYRAPTLHELYSGIWAYGYADNYYWWYRSIQGNKNLEPEKGHTENIGFEHEFDATNRLALNVFNYKLKNFIALQRSLTNTVGEDVYDYYFPEWTYSNTGEGEKIRGLEMSYYKQINNNWSFDLGYTFLNRKSLSDDNSDNSSVRFPRHSYNLGLHFRDGNFKANLLANMGDGVDNKRFDMKRYAWLNFNTSYGISDDVTLYFLVNNLTNQDYSLYGVYAHAYGRFFAAGVNCKF